MTAAIHVEDLFDHQKRDRFDFYDAAAAVNAAQKLQQKMQHMRLPYDDSVGSSSGTEGKLSAESGGLHMPSYAIKLQDGTISAEYDQ